MAYTLISHTIAGSSDGGATVSTPAIDTTGANLILIGYIYYSADPPPTLGDNKGNASAIQILNLYVTGPNVVHLAYIWNPAVGAGHVFTATSGASPAYSTLAVAAFSGAALTSPFDVQNGNTAATTATSVQTNPVTPSAGAELIVTDVGTNASVGGIAIDSGFTLLDALGNVSGQHLGLALAFKIKTDVSTENPTWSATAAGTFATAIATFKAAPPPPSPTSAMPALGLPRLLPMQPPVDFKPQNWTKMQQDDLRRIWQDIAAYVNRPANIQDLTKTVTFQAGITLDTTALQGLGVHGWASGRSFVVNLDLVVDIGSTFSGSEIRITLPFPANNFVIESGTVAVAGYEAPAPSLQKIGNLAAGFPSTSPVGGMTNVLFFSKGDGANFTTADSPLYIFGQIVLPMT